VDRPPGICNSRRRPPSWLGTIALDILALDAAVAQARTGRAWKSLKDSNNDPLCDAGRPVPWRDWQRREDYYGEGVLLWLDVDTLLEERTSGKRSFADFAGDSSVAEYRDGLHYPHLHRIDGTQTRLLPLFKPVPVRIDDRSLKNAQHNRIKGGSLPGIDKMYLIRTPLPSKDLG
jgi:hypothetical protein